MKIKDINFGISFRIKNTVYLHKNLRKYPKLREALIEHERNHTSRFTLKDIKLDLTGDFLQKVKKEYYKFMFTEKKAWMQLLPVIKVKGKIVVDPILSFVWGATILMIILILI